MTTPTPTPDPVNQNRTRLGGGLLLFGVILVMVRAVMGDILMPPTFQATPAVDMAKALADHAGAFTAYGTLGAFAALLLCAGGFLLATRPVHTPRAFPASALWIVFAVAQAISLVRYCFFATGYVTLAQNYSDASVATLFDAARGTFGLSGTFVGLAAYGSLLAIWVGEARNLTASIPAWMSWTAAGCGLLSLGGVVAGWLKAVAVAQALGFAFYPGALVGLAFALGVAWPGLPMVGASSASRQSA